MGWSQYIVIDNLKLMIEISKNVRVEEVNDISDPMSTMQKLVAKMGDFPFEEEFKEVTLKQMAKYISLANEAYDLMTMADSYLQEYMLLILLIERKVPYRIITDMDEEFNVLTKNKKYKRIDIDYKV